MKTFWYIMRVLPGKEKQMVDNFNDRIRAGLMKNIIRFFCPVEKELVVIRKKKILRDKILYSGYIYFETGEKLSEDELKHMTLFENIMTMTKTKEPILMREDDIKRVIGITDTEEVKKSHIDGLVIGDSVEINHGPFKTFTGKINEIVGEKLVLDVLVFGRPTRVTLNVEQIIKI